MDRLTRGEGDDQAGRARGPAGRSNPTCASAALSTRTAYPVIADPPLLAGGVQLTVPEVGLSTEAVPMVGAPGTVEGMTRLDGAEKCPVPKAFVAATCRL